MISGLSYGSATGGSLAYPISYRHRPRWNFNQANLAIVLELVHPGNLGTLPPSPFLLASKGEQMGLGARRDFVRYF